MTSGPRRRPSADPTLTPGSDRSTGWRFYEATPSAARPVLSRITTGLVNTLFAPAWLVLWLQTRHQVRDDGWGIDPMGTSDPPTVDDVHGRAIRLVQENTQEVPELGFDIGRTASHTLEDLQALPQIEREGIEEMLRYDLDR